MWTKQNHLTHGLSCWKSGALTLPPTSRDLQSCPDPLWELGTEGLCCKGEVATKWDLRGSREHKGGTEGIWADGQLARFLSTAGPGYALGCQVALPSVAARPPHHIHEEGAWARHSPRGCDCPHPLSGHSGSTLTAC